MLAFTLITSTQDPSSLQHAHCSKSPYLDQKKSFTFPRFREYFSVISKKCFQSYRNTFKFIFRNVGKKSVILESCKRLQRKIIFRIYVKIFSVFLDFRNFRIISYRFSRNFGIFSPKIPKTT